MRSSTSRVNEVEDRKMRLLAFILTIPREGWKSLGKMSDFRLYRGICSTKDRLWRSPACPTFLHFVPLAPLFPSSFPHSSLSVLWQSADYLFQRLTFGTKFSRFAYELQQVHHSFIFFLLLKPYTFQSILYCSKTLRVEILFLK